MKIKQTPFKIIVYSDVHGNIDALKTFMNSDDYKTANLKVFLGDAVAMGPHPNECLKAIFNSGDIFLMGNHDSYMAFGMPKEELPFFKADKLEHQTYMRNLVTTELKERLKKLKYEFVLEINNQKLLFTHYIWETKRIICDNPENPNLQNISKLFSNYNFNYIFYGHEHAPSYFKDNKHYICVGSLGMKKEANYVLITVTNKINIEQKQVKYDVKKVQNEIINSVYPRAVKYASWLD